MMTFGVVVLCTSLLLSATEWLYTVSSCVLFMSAPESKRKGGRLTGEDVGFEPEIGACMIFELLSIVILSRLIGVAGLLSWRPGDEVSEDAGKP